MKFGLFVPQGWRMDLVGIDPGQHWGVMAGLARRADANDDWSSIWVYDHFHTVPEPTARPRTRRGPSWGRSPPSPAASAWARCAPAWPTATPPTSPRSPRRSTSSPAAASRWASAPAGTSTSGAPTATASRPPASGSALDEGVQIFRQMWTTGAATRGQALPGRRRHLCPPAPAGHRLPGAEGTASPCGSPAAARRRRCASPPSTPSTPTSTAAPEGFARKRECCAGTARTSAATSTRSPARRLQRRHRRDRGRGADRLAWIGSAPAQPGSRRRPTDQIRPARGLLVGTPEQIVEKLRTCGPAADLRDHVLRGGGLRPVGHRALREQVIPELVGREEHGHKHHLFHRR